MLPQPQAATPLVITGGTRDCYTPKCPDGVTPRDVYIETTDLQGTTHLYVSDSGDGRSAGPLNNRWKDATDSGTKRLYVGPNAPDAEISITVYGFDQGENSGTLTLRTAMFTHIADDTMQVIVKPAAAAGDVVIPQLGTVKGAVYKIIEDDSNGRSTSTSNVPVRCQALVPHSLARWLACSVCLIGQRLVGACTAGSLSQTLLRREVGSGWLARTFSSTNGSPLPVPRACLLARPMQSVLASERSFAASAIWCAGS
jgi:hypothetical protein